MIGDVTQAAYLGPWLWKAAVEKAGSFDIDKVVAASPGIELTTAPEGYVKVHENHHLWSKARIGQWQADGQAMIVYESASDRAEPVPERLPVTSRRWPAQSGAWGARLRTDKRLRTVVNQIVLKGRLLGRIPAK